MDWRHIGELLAAGRAAYSELKNLCVWSKHNAGMGSLYRSQHELVFVFKNGRWRAPARSAPARPRAREIIEEFRLRFHSSSYAIVAR